MADVTFNETAALKTLETRINDILQDAYDEVNQLLDNAGANEMSEIELMQLNIAVSRFNTFITLVSGIYKNLCDGEKTIAQKM